MLRKALSRSTVLSAERERELLQRYHANEDRAAMDELVRSHMPIIVRVAGRSAQNPGVDINDLVQTATEGLLIAINRWSFEKSDASGACNAMALADEQDADMLAAAPDAAQAAPELPRSSRLATYAMWWMRILLTNTVIENRGMIVRAKNPKTRKALFNLPAAIRKLDIALPLTGSDVTRIAAYLGIAEREIEEALVHAAGDVMLDEPVGDGAMLRGDAMPDSRAEGEDGILSRLASTDRWGAVCEALMDLAPRERFILITRYLLTSKWKLDRLSDTLKMSRERIRQIGDDSLERIRNRVSAHGVRHDPAHQQAVEQAEALVTAVEQASTSGDATAIERLLIAQNIAIGPTRTLKRRLPTAMPRTVSSFHPVPRCAAMPQASCG
jgi:RNA polymerase sigma-32 factor